MLKPTHLLATVVTGLILIAVAMVSLTQRVPTPTNAGVVPGGASASQAVVDSSPVRSSPARAGQTQGSKSPARTSPVAAGAASGATRPVNPAAAPSVLIIPTLDVTAPVEAVHVVRGELQVPDDPRTVGWWEASVAPGSAAGSTVIDGHIDSAVAGVGALFHLSDLGPGDEVSVRTHSGRLLAYTVQARRVYLKATGLPADIFDQSGPARLVLISCGGTFDAAAHSYRDNIVVYATPRE